VRGWGKGMGTRELTWSQIAKPNRKLYTVLLLYFLLAACADSYRTQLSIELLRFVCPESVWEWKDGEVGFIIRMRSGLEQASSIVF
jgi:hypothetical protein